MRNSVQVALLMAIFTLVSKILGFVREMVMAAFFGTSYITDAYVMANTIPGIIFGGILGAIATAYIPVFSKISEIDGDKEGERFTSEVINILFLLSVLAGVIGIVFSDQIVLIFASGFTGETARLTSFYVKITFCYVIFTATSGILNAYLQYKGIFLPQIAAGFVQNLGIIAVIIISGYTNHYYLAFGMLIGTAASFTVVAIVARRQKYSHSLTLSKMQTLKEIMTLAVPVFIGSSLIQINTFVDKTLASGLTEGSVAALNYGMLLVTMATGLTTGILITLIYPKITKANALKEHVIFNDILEKGVTIIIMISIPCALGAMSYSNTMVKIVFERGVFDSSATIMTSSAFFFYAIGLPAVTLSGLFTHVYYSIHDMKTPIYFALIGVLINVIVNFALIKPMAHNGLALATSIAANANAILLYWGLKKKYPHIILIQSWGKILKLCIASLISIGSSLLFYQVISSIIPKVQKTLQFGSVVIFAGVIYLIMLKLIKIEEVNLIKQIIQKR